jgi:hypothetical protein
VIINFIRQKYSLVKEYTIKLLFVPFIVYLLAFASYLNIVQPLYMHYYRAVYFREAVDASKAAIPTSDPPLADNDGQEDNEALLTFLYVLCVVWQVAIVILSCYFLKNELKQIYIDKLYYFFSIWNYIDIIPPLASFAIVLVFHTDLHPGTYSTTEAVLNSIAVFFIWMKGLYFMRIFDSFSYLIRMIVNVISDMKTFLIVLFITIIAFADAFFSLSEANKEPFVSGLMDSIVFVYRMSLGDWEWGETGDVAVPLAVSLFLLCTLFNMIVMFNLLIAIISETFANVNQFADEAGYQEKAALIAENSYLIPEDVRKAHSPQDSYLIQAIDLGSEFVDAEAGEDKNLEAIDAIKKNLLDLNIKTAIVAKAKENQAKEVKKVSIDDNKDDGGEETQKKTAKKGFGKLKSITEAKIMST